MRIFPLVFKNFSKRERGIFAAAFLMFILSLFFVAIDFIGQKTILIPVSGGEFIEGVVGQPVFINPVLASSEADRDLIELIFSDLLELAENYRMNENGRVWNVRLKDNLFWHDGQPITADDVILTINFIQNPDSHSPLSSVWQGVKAERISEREIKLILPETYVFFENTLRELRIIPNHVFAPVPITNLRLSDYNLEPIGNGPFKFASFQKKRSGFVSGYHLVRNEYYVGKKPYLEKIVFNFYQNEEELTIAFNSGKIGGFGGLKSKTKINHQSFALRMPRYYAIFFNAYEQDVLKDKNVRLALIYATDKKKIIEKILNNDAIVVDGPLILGMNGYSGEAYPRESFSPEKAIQILEANGWQLNSDGIRENEKEGAGKKKEVARLEFNLVVPEMPLLIETARLIQEDWLKIGVKLNLIIKPVAEVSSEIIRTRNYEMLIFGNVFKSGDCPDLSSFWHSGERFYPGLNLALYENKTADALIESIRKNLNNEKRQRDLAVLQSLIIQDSPAIFLFSPHYFYITKNSLRGFDEKFIYSASGRFQNIEKWYVKTARVFE